MSRSLDLQVLTQTHFDSGALSGLGAVAHPLAEAGDHRMTVLADDHPVQTLSLRVLAAAEAPATPLTGAPLPPPGVSIPPVPPMRLRPPLPGVPVASAGPTAIHVDLGSLTGRLGQMAPSEPTSDLEVGSNGYAVFHAPPGTTGLAVQLHRPGATDDSPAFDSRTLSTGDVFATPLLRPGHYTVTNAATGAKADIHVSYPVIGDTPYRPPDPFDVHVTAGGFEPATVQLMPAQGVIFRIDGVDARIQIDLAEPDDGPAAATSAAGTGAEAAPRAPLYRWQKSVPPEG
jgi:hypothetical protein